ncbi:MAG: 4Fe-4S binding protein [Candidatus Methanofastidiosia archaeon]
MKSEILLKIDNCMFCGCCEAVCPQNCVFVTEYSVGIGKECTFCRLCEKACPMSVISYKVIE